MGIYSASSRRRSSVGEMDHLLGMVGDGYALVAADRKVSNSIIAVKHDEDKILALDESKLLGCVGELGDTKNFTEFIQKNIALYGLRNGSKLSTHATAHYVRGEIAYAIRSSPKMCNMILVGYDDAGASLYHIDYLGYAQDELWRAWLWRLFLLLAPGPPVASEHAARGGYRAHEKGLQGNQHALPCRRMHFHAQGRDQRRHA